MTQAEIETIRAKAFKEAEYVVLNEPFSDRRAIEQAERAIFRIRIHALTTKDG